MTKIHKNLEFDSNVDLSNVNLPNDLKIRYLSHADYEKTHAKMLAQTLARIEAKKNGQYYADELWVVEHNDVYTLGQAGKVEHILQRGNTPIIQTDRGGQVTWHGKGQLVLYWLFDLKNLGWSVRDLVSHAEQSLEDAINEALLLSALYPAQQSQPTANDYAKARQDAPGVYIYRKVADGKNPMLSATMLSNTMLGDTMLGKIASLGFKIKQGFSYHGIALNLNCDLSAFDAINPCGYAGMQMLRLADFVPRLNDNDAESHTNTSSACKEEAALGAINLVHANQVNANPPNAINRPYNHGSHGSHAIHDLSITQHLIDNIKQRQAGDIPLRVPSDLPHA